MGILLRVAVALLIAGPLLLILVLVSALVARRVASLPLESGSSGSLEREVSSGPPFRVSEVILGVSR
jgi:hypothetical protein